MDMTENDEQLLMRFFDEHRRDIPDNGFTQRVMRQLPARTLRLSRIWTWLCWAVGIALFFFMDGVGQLRNVFASLSSDVVNIFSSMHYPLITIVLTSVVLLTLLLVEVYRLAEEY